MKFLQVQTNQKRTAILNLENIDAVVVYETYADVWLSGDENYVLTINIDSLARLVAAIDEYTVK